MTQGPQARKEGELTVRRTPRLLYGDVPQGALVAALKKWPSGAIVSDEAGALHKGRTFNNLYIHNIVWGGGPIVEDRKDQPPLRVVDARLSICLMLQPGTLRKFLEGKGELARESGALARYLIAYPVSTQGFRFETSGVVQKTDAIDAFNCRIGELLNDSITPEGEPVARKVLSLSVDAAEEYIRFYNWIEQSLAPGGFYADISDAGSKAADNMCRIASLLHCFEKKEGPIDLETIKRAIEILVWYLNEFKRLFGLQPQAPQEQQDAVAIDAWLWEWARKYNDLRIKRNLILQYGPNGVRNRARVELALKVLESWGRIASRQEGRTWYVYLMTEPQPIVISEPPAVLH